MKYVGTTPGNARNIMCPSCYAVICPRCAQFEDRLSPDGYDGCDACRRAMTRIQREYRAHIAKDHTP